MKRKVGRPAKVPDDLITLEMAVQVIKEELAKKYPPEVAKLLAYAPGTIRNKVSKGELHSWPRGRYAFLSKAEVIKLVS